MLQKLVHFTCDSILRHPDLSLLFVTGLDHLKKGIKAILSQCHRNPPKLSPYTVFSQKLSTAQMN